MGGTNIWTQAAGSRAHAANHHIHSLSGPYAWLPQYAVVGLLAPSVARCAPWIPGAISPFASGHSIGREYQGCGGERDLITFVWLGVGGVWSLMGHRDRGISSATVAQMAMVCRIVCTGWTLAGTTEKSRLFCSAISQCQPVHRVPLGTSVYLGIMGK